MDSSADHHRNGVWQMKHPIETKPVHPAAAAAAGDNGEVWIAYATAQAEAAHNCGEIRLKELHSGVSAVLTETMGDNTVCDIAVWGGAVYVLYAQYQDAGQQILLTKWEKSGALRTREITPCGKYGNPAMAVWNGRICVVWEAFLGGANLLELLQLDADLCPLCEPLTVTNPSERAYRPSVIANQEQLYLVYESFLYARYHLIALAYDGNGFSDPVDVGFPDKNDQHPSLALYRGRVLVAWENSSPLKKGFVWTDPNGTEITIPAFGHGWAVESRFGLRSILYRKGVWSIQALAGAASPEVRLSEHTSSGCPHIMVDPQNHLLLSFLEWHAGNTGCGWKIVTKYYDGSHWVDFSDALIGLYHRAKPVVWQQPSSLCYLATDFLTDGNAGKPWTQQTGGLTAAPCANALYHPAASARNGVPNPPACWNLPKARPISGIPLWTTPEERSLYTGAICTCTPTSPGAACTRNFTVTKWRTNTVSAGTSQAWILRSNTDHDGMTDYEWNRVRKAANLNYLPGYFVPFVGVEWTCSMSDCRQNFGHYNILHRQDGPIYRTSDPKTDGLEKLYAQLDPDQTLAIPHHPNDSMHLMDWEYFNDTYSPLVEIFQVRGSSEYDHCPMEPEAYGRKSTQNHSVRYGLNRGYHFGFTSGGEHEGVGVTAIYASGATREEIFDALKARRTYGTTGDRIVLEYRVNGKLMGSEIESAENPVLEVTVFGTAKIRDIRIVRDGKTLKTIPCGAKDHRLQFVDTEFAQFASGSEHYYYVVIAQENDEMAWASPVFVTKVILSGCYWKITIARAALPATGLEFRRPVPGKGAHPDPTQTKKPYPSSDFGNQAEKRAS